MTILETMSSGKTVKAAPLDHRFDTSDISLGTPAGRRTPPPLPRVVRIPPRMPAIPTRVAAAHPEDDGFASGSVIAIVTEDAEPIHIHERRDTLEQPPMRREGVPPAPISDDPTVPTRTPRDVVAAKRGVPPLRI